MPDLTAMSEAATAEARGEILAAMGSSGQSTGGNSVGHGEIRLRGGGPAPAAPADPSPAGAADPVPAATEGPPEAGAVGHGRIRLR
jgi:hypothetical protein